MYLVYSAHLLVHLLYCTMCDDVCIQTYNTFCFRIGFSCKKPQEYERVSPFRVVPGSFPSPQGSWLEHPESRWLTVVSPSDCCALGVPKFWMLSVVSRNCPPKNKKCIDSVYVIQKRKELLERAIHFKLYRAFERWFHPQFENAPPSGAVSSLSVVNPICSLSVFKSHVQGFLHC